MRDRDSSHYRCLPELRAAHGLDAAQLESAAVAASPGAMALCNNRTPKDEMQTHISLHHWMAVCLIRGTARTQDMDTETAVRARSSEVDARLGGYVRRESPSQAKDLELDRVNLNLSGSKDPALMAFQNRVEATLDPGRATDSAEVTITTTDARRYTSRIEHGIGSAARPMTDAELARTRMLMAQCWDLARLADAGDLAWAAA
jgi:hypothetical protein